MLQAAEKWARLDQVWAAVAAEIAMALRLTVLDCS
jgi:hypothetical protein